MLSPMPANRALPVWRLSLLWRGTVLDVVTLEGKRERLQLRTGDELSVRVLPDALEIRGFQAAKGADTADTFGSCSHLTLRSGACLVLPAGHVLHAELSEAPIRRRGLPHIDSTLLHATMIGAAFQVCVVSALILAPPRAFDPDPGAGWASELRRVVSLPGGTAAQAGQPTFVPVGRSPLEEERAEPVRARGSRPTLSGKGPSAEEALEEMKRTLHLGDSGLELREALGELARQVARAPELGAGFGGLSPREPADRGPGTGIIGAGISELPRIIRAQTERMERAFERKPKGERLVGRVELMEVPQGFVVLDESSLDPVVRDELNAAVRERHNTIRSCYEVWGLAADAKRTGRLELELTLTPDGRVTDPVVRVSSPGLKHVARCVSDGVREWYLGDGLFDEATRLRFPFVLQPRKDVKGGGFDDERVPGLVTP